MKKTLCKWWFAGGLILLLVGVIGTIAFFKLVEYKMTHGLKPQEFAHGFSNGVNFRYATLDGQTRYISEQKGNVVFVNFWGTWCAPCVVEMPTIEKLYEMFRDDPSVKFVVASRLDSAERVKSFASRHHYDLPFYTIRDEDIPISMRFNQYPATFIYAKDGSLAATHIGSANWADISVVAFINKLKTMKANKTSLAPETPSPPGSPKL